MKSPKPYKKGWINPHKTKKIIKRAAIADAALYAAKKMYDYGKQYKNKIADDSHYFREIQRKIEEERQRLAAQKEQELNEENQRKMLLFNQEQARKLAEEAQRQVQERVRQKEREEYQRA